MTAPTQTIDARAAGLGLFEKWLSVWVGGAILAIALTDHLIRLIVHGDHGVRRDLADQSQGE